MTVEIEEWLVIDGNGVFSTETSSDINKDEEELSKENGYIGLTKVKKLNSFFVNIDSDDLKAILKVN